MANNIIKSVYCMAFVFLFYPHLDVYVPKEYANWLYTFMNMQIGCIPLCNLYCICTSWKSWRFGVMEHEQIPHKKIYCKVRANRWQVQLQSQLSPPSASSSHVYCPYSLRDCFYHFDTLLEPAFY